MPIATPCMLSRGLKVTKFLGYIVVIAVISLTPLCYIAHPLNYSAFDHMGSFAHLF